MNAIRFGDVICRPYEIRSDFVIDVDQLLPSLLSPNLVVDIVEARAKVGVDVE